jgi:hypothetical protein
MHRLYSLLDIDLTAVDLTAVDLPAVDLPDVDLFTTFRPNCNR